MCRSLLSLVLVYFVFTFTPLRGQEWDEPTEEGQKLTASDGAAMDLFAFSSAISGDIAVAGAWLDDDNGAVSGSAYVFRYDPDEEQWVEEQKLTASDGEAVEYFGYSVSVWGDVIVVGAFGDDDNGTLSGSAYVFRYDSDDEEWVEEQKLTASDGASFHQFGFSSAAYSDLVVLGAHGDDDNGTASGSAYIFRYDPDDDVWLEEQKLTASDGAAFDEFGHWVAVDGDLVLLGADADDDNGFDSGSAYIFRYDPDDEEWLEEQKLTASDGAASDEFGRSVSISDGVALIGAALDDDNGTDSGSAYVFRYDSDDEEWSEEQKLAASDGAASDQFGASVAVSDGMVIIGASQDDDNGTDSGSAYVFRYDSGDEEWLEEQKLAASDGSASDAFGTSVAVSADGALVGAIGDDDNDADSGSAYVFNLQDTNYSFLRGDCDGSGAVSALPDGLFLLRWQFAGGDKPPCMDAADCDDSGTVSALPDALFLLRWGFEGGDDPPAPGTEECGIDPLGDEPDEIYCDEEACG